jgi:hypothetical protein
MVIRRRHRAKAEKLTFLAKERTTRRRKPPPKRSLDRAPSAGLQVRLGHPPGDKRLMGTKAYLLWFVSEADEEDDNGLLIGVYRSESMAKAAIERLRAKPGFADYPEGFQVHSRELDQDSWTEGFSRE